MKKENSLKLLKGSSHDQLGEFFTIPDVKRNDEFVNLQRKVNFYKADLKKIHKVLEQDRCKFFNYLAYFSKLPSGYSPYKFNGSGIIGNEGFVGMHRVIGGKSFVYEINTRIDELTKKKIAHDNQNYLCSEERDEVFSQFLDEYFTINNVIWVFDHKKFDLIFRNEITRIEEIIKRYEDEISDIYLSYYEPIEDDNESYLESMMIEEMIEMEKHHRYQIGLLSTRPIYAINADGHF